MAAQRRLRSTTAIIQKHVFQFISTELLISLYLHPIIGGVAGVVGIESSVVSGVFNLESSGVGTPDRRPRHDKSYHEG